MGYDNPAWETMERQNMALVFTTLCQMLQQNSTVGTPVLDQINIVN